MSCTVRDCASITRLNSLFRMPDFILGERIKMTRTLYPRKSMETPLVSDQDTWEHQCDRSDDPVNQEMYSDFSPTWTDKNGGIH